MCDEWPMVAMSLRSVTLGLRSITVVAWCRRSWGRTPSMPTTAQAAVQAWDRSCRRRGSPVDRVKTKESAGAAT